MYINDVHIFAYLVLAAIGAVVGQFVDWIVIRTTSKKAIFSNEILEYIKTIKLNYKTIAVNSIMYIILTYVFGISSNLLENKQLIEFMVLVPILIAIFIIDYKNKIIPNRLTLTLFEIGICFTFLYGLDNIYMARDMLLGMIVGTIIFIIIALLGNLIAGKETMGMGDVKLVAVLGLYFGLSVTVALCVLSFIIAAIVMIVILLNKTKKSTDYMPFGPYIIISALICIILPKDFIVSALLCTFTLGRIR